MIRFRTKTGSVYEVDETNKRAQMVYPEEREAREFTEHTPIKVGNSVVFAWAGDEVHCSITSPVVQINDA